MPWGGVQQTGKEEFFMGPGVWVKHLEAIVGGQWRFLGIEMSATSCLQGSTTEWLWSLSPSSVTPVSSPEQPQSSPGRPWWGGQSATFPHQNHMMSLS